MTSCRVLYSQPMKTTALLDLAVNFIKKKKNALTSFQSGKSGTSPHSLPPQWKITYLWHGKTGSHLWKECSRCRFISVLNRDMRIIAKVLAACLEKVHCHIYSICKNVTFVLNGFRFCTHHRFGPYGFRAKNFSIERGSRQCCPLSSL